MLTPREYPLGYAETFGGPDGYRNVFTLMPAEQPRPEIGISLQVRVAGADQIASPASFSNRLANRPRDR